MENKSKQTAPRANPLQDDGSLPIYAEIQRTIEGKIMSGDWAPGFRIPSEAELCEMYGCSRMTVNKALSSLAAAGMIIRRRGAGSHVAPPRVEEPLMTIRDIRAEVLSMDRTYSFDVSDRAVRQVLDGADARHIGVPLRTRMLYLDVLHYADNLPFALETWQISLTGVPEAARQAFDDEPPGTWLLRNVPWTEAEHSVRAISADRVMAKRLGITDGAACMSIARRTWRGADLVTFVRIIYPGDRHRFLVRFTPSGGAPNP